MACGATLKRTMDFDPLMSPTSPKRRRCIPVSTSSSSPRKYLSMEPSPFGEFSSTLSAGNATKCHKFGLLWSQPGALPTCCVRLQRGNTWESLTTVQMCVLRSFVPPEQILHSIKQEYKRIQKRKHLDGGYLQSECSYSPESPSQSSSMHISSMSGWLPHNVQQWVSQNFIQCQIHWLYIYIYFWFVYTQEHPLEEFHPLEKNSHYSPSDKLELFVSVCSKKGKRRCGRNMKKPWLQNWQVGTQWSPGVDRSEQSVVHQVYFTRWISSIYSQDSFIRK